MTEFLQQSPAVLCAAGIIILSAVVYALRGDFERRFIDYTDEAIKRDDPRNKRTPFSRHP